MDILLFVLKVIVGTIASILGYALFNKITADWDGRDEKMNRYTKSVLGEGVMLIGVIAVIFLSLLIYGIVQITLH